MSEKISYTQKNLFNQLGLQIARCFPEKKKNLLVKFSRGCIQPMLCFPPPFHRLVGISVVTQDGRWPHSKPR